MTLKICRADLKRDTDWLSKMDPYCLVFYEGKKLKTDVLQEAGKNPVWNMPFKIFINDTEGSIKFEVRDEDNLSSDLVGKTECIARDILFGKVGE